MYGRTKKQPERGRERTPRTPAPKTTAKPTFSYYANRPDDTQATNRRSVERAKNSNVQTGGRARKRISFARAQYWLLAIIVVVCIGKLLYLGNNPKLVVLGKSSVTGTYLQPVDTYTQYAKQLLSSSITNHTKLTANINGTTNALERQFPELQSVSVAVPLIGNRPIVYVAVAQPSVVLQAGSTNYALNRDGLVLAKLSSLPAGIPTLTDQSGVTPQIGKQLLPGSVVTFITAVNYQLKAARIPISTFVLPQTSPYELDVRLEGVNYILKCNLQADATVQSGAAIATIKQLTSKQPTSYIDVRVPERVYYK